MRNRRGRCGRCQRQTDPYTLESNKRELVCTTVLLSELNWFISGGKYQPEWKKRKVCQFLKVQRGEGEKCFAAFPSSMPNCSEPFSICNPESTWKNFAWSKSNMNGDVSAGVHALIFGVYAENKCMLFVSCAPLCAACTYLWGRKGRKWKKKKKWRTGQYPRPSVGTHYALVMVFATHDRLHSLSFPVACSNIHLFPFSLSPGAAHTQTQKELTTFKAPRKRKKKISENMIRGSEAMALNALCIWLLSKTKKSYKVAGQCWLVELLYRTRNYQLKPWWKSSCSHREAC